MARNKVQRKIEKFLSALTEVCNEYDMIVDANGGGYAGTGKDRGDVRFREGCPLVLYTKSGINYRKIGYLWYSFIGEDETLVYNFEPGIGSSYKEVVIPDTYEFPKDEDKDEDEDENIEDKNIEEVTEIKEKKLPKPKDLPIKEPIKDETNEEFNKEPIEKSNEILNEALRKAKEWQANFKKNKKKNKRKY